MSLKFSVTRGSSKESRYRAIVHPGSRLPYDRFLQHVQDSTSLSPTDVRYAVDAAVEWIVACALDGRECDLGELGRSRLGIRGTFDGPVPERITHDDVQVTLSWNLSPKLLRRFRTRLGELELERVRARDLAPLIAQVRTAGRPQDLPDAWRAGGILHIQGLNLSLDDQREDEGVFLTAAEGTATHRIPVYARAAIKNIVCQVPRELAGAGALRLEVRRRPPRLPDGEPQVGKYETILEEVQSTE